MKRSLFFLAALLFLTGCNDINTPASGITNNGHNGCATGVAQIGVFEGFLEDLCGCNEGDGVVTTPPQSLHCTVKVNTTVYFQYIALKHTHQIIGTGTPNLGTSGPSNPDDDDPLRAFVFIPTIAGNYVYEDNFDDAINGIVVAQ